MKKKIVLGFMTFIVTLLTITTLASPASADTYANFSALKAHKTVNVDYKIVSNDTPSSTAIIAIHGGTIERETTEIASAVASQGRYDFYSFEGLQSNSSSLHITATNFDETTARNLVAKSTKTLSIHGSVGSQAITYVGGLDTTLAQKVKASLQAAGFKVAFPPSSLAGQARNNICNSNSIHKGVQLELSTSMRNQLANNSQAFNLYVAALVKALN